MGDGLSNEMFMRQNAVGIKNIKYVVGKYYKDEHGEPVEWEIRSLNYAEIEEILVGCLKKGPRGLTIDFPKSVNAIMTNSVVVPNLNDVKLQDRYGVKSKEELIKVMLTSKEYYVLFDKVRGLLGGVMGDVGEVIESSGKVI